MAIVAYRRSAMAALHPTRVLLIHHMAVRTGLGIVCQIGRGFGILRRIGACTDQNPTGQCQDDRHGFASKDGHTPIIASLASGAQ